jgi:RNA polymerase sigma-70 factor (TIGR02960 family)
VAGQAVPGEAGELVAAAIAGEAGAFDTLAERHRRELHVHCYRMLASFDDAEDAVQETFLRAWRGRDSFEGRAKLRSWLYRIATNVCLDALRRRAHRATTVTGSDPEVPWLQPYPDRLLDEAAGTGGQPEGAAIERETIELAFVTALQVLPPRQRATLIARDVLGWPASQTAVLLEMSVAAANSALQRARATMREHLPARRADWPGDAAGRLSAAERDLLAAFIDAHQRCDAAAAVAIAARDIRITMPPYPMRYDGVAAIGPLLDRAFGPDRDGDWRLVPTAANRMPAAASYLRRPGDTKFRAVKLDVLRTGGGRIAEITTFTAGLFPAFGLPATLGPGRSG